MSEPVTLPEGNPDERELLLGWLGYLRGAVLRNLDGLTDAQGRWRPDGALIPLVGVANHLTHVEWRWIDGGMLGRATRRDEAEFTPSGLSVHQAVEAYRQRARATDDVVRRLPLSTACATESGTDLRWVLLHLVNETARHAGHADAVRELLDGTTGE